MRTREEERTRVFRRNICFQTTCQTILISQTTRSRKNRDQRSHTMKHWENEFNEIEFFGSVIHWIRLCETQYKTWSGRLHWSSGTHEHSTRAHISLSTPKMRRRDGSNAILMKNLWQISFKWDNYGEYAKYPIYRWRVVVVASADIDA